MDGFMKRKWFSLCRNLVPGVSAPAGLALVVVLCGATMVETAAAQTADAQAAATQAPRVQARITQPVDEGSLVTLRGNVHPSARAEFDRGPVADSQPATRMALVLQRSQEQETALETLLNNQQTKGSPNFHAWLTPTQFAQQFGPADSDIQTITDWLTSHGFTGIIVGTGRTTIQFSGTVGQVRSAFHTEIHHFQVNGEAHMANVSDPQIPAALAPVIGGIAGLHDFRAKALVHKLGPFRKDKETGEITPLFTYTGCGPKDALPCYAVGPGDFEKIYNVPYVAGTTDGTGVTIAIVQDSNINVSDVQNFRSIFALPPNPSTNIILDGPDPGIQGPDSVTGDETEADLDVEWSGAVAPGATIDLVVSETPDTIGLQGTDLSAIYIIDNNIAPIMSESFGACEAAVGSAGEAFYNALWQQASAQGITVILSAGDTGSAACDPLTTATNLDVATQGIAVSGLASTVYNVAIGGTDFSYTNASPPSTYWNTTNAATTQVSAKGYIPESTWNDSCASTAGAGNITGNTCTSTTINNDDTSSSEIGPDLTAGSGGPSKLNANPAWQSGINGLTASSFRQLPDVSFFAGNGFNGSFYIICEEDANTGSGSSTTTCNLNSPYTDFIGAGGTSFGAPAFAGVMALVNQKTGQRQGNTNYVLYQLYKKNTTGTICTSNAATAASTGSCIFYDTVTGNNSVACQGGSTNCSNTSTAASEYGILVEPSSATTPAWETTAGYDNATGLGTLNVANLLSAWSSATFTSDTVAITCSAAGNSCSSSSAISITHGSNATFNVSVTPSAATGQVALIAEPTGSAQVGIGAFSQETGALSGGSVSITTNQLPGGTSYPVIASYAGDGTYAAGTSSPVMVTVMPEASNTAVSLWTVSATGPGQETTTAPYGSYVVQIAVSDSNANQCYTIVVACPTGTVTLTSDGNPVKDFSGTNSTKLNSQGIAEDQIPSLAVGSYSLVATYSGDNSFNGSTSTADAVTITTATTTTSVAATPATGITPNTSVTLTATIATQSAAAGPTGTVTFAVNGTALGPAVTVVPTAASLTSSTPASATATLSHTFTSSGSVTVTATYTPPTSGANYSGSSGTTTFSVGTGGTTATTTVVTSSSTSITSGATVTLTATVTGTGNNGPGATGTVQFMNNGSALGSPATCNPTAGTSSTPGSCTATLMTALSMLTPPPAPRQTPKFPVGPMWIVACLLLLAFLLSLRRLPTAKRLRYACAGVLLFGCVAAGIAGCGGGSSSSTTPTSHTDSITGVYSGDSNYATSTSAAVSITVQ
jgi:subtilase family serine protease